LPKEIHYAIMRQQIYMNDIYEILKNLEIEFLEHEHPAVFTVEEAQVHKGHLDGMKLKNLFLRNKKGDRHFLFITLSQKDIDLKKLSAVTKERKLGFASPERLKKYLDLTPGSVGPFGLINDTKKEVIVFLDREILSGEKLNFHPNRNTATVQITKDDFLKFLAWSENVVLEVEV